MHTFTLPDASLRRPARPLNRGRPVGGAVIILLLALLAAQCRLPRGERGLCAVTCRPETLTLQLWLLLLLYPSLAKISAAPFACMSVGDARLLRAEPSVACNDGGWLGLGVLGGLGTGLLPHSEHGKLPSARRSRVPSL